ncbi:hypothetical protein J31TS4_39440 [Paenibacillus sp. J31TS4]|nr:hypothetical protein [Paenibacillus sp. J31TS4]GIP40664.1 hypothetical protein J31TS4_39440 [Paenibacillus sp. J31TS4]
MGRVILMMNVTLDGCCDHTQVIADEEKLTDTKPFGSGVVVLRYTPVR